MKLAASTEAYAAKFGEEEAIRILARAGFDSIDFTNYSNMGANGRLSGDNYLENAKQIRAVADESGVTVDQSHAPFPAAFASRDESLVRFKQVVRSFEISRILGVKQTVVHPYVSPTNRYGREKDKALEENYQLYRALEPYAEENGIKIAIENMFDFDPEAGKICRTTCSTPEELISLKDALGDNFTVLIDVGHFQLTGIDPEEGVRAIGHRLGGLHVHDNDGVEDLHDMPFLYSIDWDAFCRSLKEIGYQGNFTFEADNFPRHFPDELLPDAARMLHQVGRYFINKYEL